MRIMFISISNVSNRGMRIKKRDWFQKYSYIYMGFVRVFNGKFAYTIRRKSKAHLSTLVSLCSILVHSYIQINNGLL